MLTPDQIESATADQQREVLEALWQDLRGVTYAGDHRQRIDFARFRAMLYCGALVDAALMLVPEGWEISLYLNAPDFPPEAQMENEKTRAAWMDPITGRAPPTTEPLPLPLPSPSPSPLRSCGLRRWAMDAETVVRRPFTLHDAAMAAQRFHQSALAHLNDPECPKRRKALSEALAGLEGALSGLR